MEYADLNRLTYLSWVCKVRLHLSYHGFYSLSRVHLGAQCQLTKSQLSDSCLVHMYIAIQASFLLHIWQSLTGMFCTPAQEAMRMRPVASTGVTRFAKRNMQLGQYFIPKGTMLLVPFDAVHHFHGNWEDPDSFMPVCGPPGMLASRQSSHAYFSYMQLAVHIGLPHPPSKACSKPSPSRACVGRTADGAVLFRGDGHTHTLSLRHPGCDSMQMFQRPRLTPAQSRTKLAAQELLGAPNAFCRSALDPGSAHLLANPASLPSVWDMQGSNSD